MRSCAGRGADRLSEAAAPGIAKGGNRGRHESAGGNGGRRPALHRAGADVACRMHLAAGALSIPLLP